MSLSLQFLHVLWILLPGLAAVIAESRRNVTQAVRPLPGSNSVLLLAIVPFVSLIAHTTISVVIELAKFVHEKTGFGLELNFEPNLAYSVLSDNLTSTEGIFPIYAATWLISAAILGFLLPTFAAGMSSVIRALMKKESTERRKGEHWIDFLIRQAQPDNVYLAGFVATTRETEQFLVGYSGPVERIKLDEDGTPLEVTLINAVPFMLDKDGNRLEYFNETTERIPYITFSPENIYSISLEVRDGDGSPEQYSQEPEAPLSSLSEAAPREID